MRDTFKLTYSSYSRASKVFEYFASEGDAVGMGRDGKSGKWFVIVAA